MKTYTVVLPIEVAGRIYQHGASVELDEEQAALYSHALRANQAGVAEAPPAATVMEAAAAAGPHLVPKNAGETIDGSHS